MKNRYQFAAGLLVGAVLFGGTTAHAAAGIMAERSTHNITVDGQPVAVEAYTINGANYFKLRDLGELVDFGVTWNGDTSTVEIDTTTGYTPERPTVAPAPQTTPQPTKQPTPQPSQDPAVYSARVEVVERVNALRRANGQAALTMDPDLMAAAQVRAEEVAANLAYRHERPDGSGIYTVVMATGNFQMGENLGAKDDQGMDITELAQIQTESWRNSEGHYSNLLRADYHSTGVGIARDKYGMYYIVQIFALGDYTILGVDDPIILKK